jgi:nitrogen fixation/metabolism regulation signal transduction histidine kinase
VSYEQLETIFENLFANSQRAIYARLENDPSVIGQIIVKIWKKKDSIAVIVQDNGISYQTVSGRGQPQIKKIIKELGGNFRKYKNPYRIYISFPYF